MGCGCVPCFISVVLLTFEVVEDVDDPCWHPWAARLDKAEMFVTYFFKAWILLPLSNTSLVVQVDSILCLEVFL